MQECINSDELYHYGIKGMKWGVRRFQNSNGSLPRLGRKRYDGDIDRAKKQAKLAKKEKTKANNKKMKAELNDQALSHPTAYWMNKNAKTAVSSGVAAIATAAVGSAATYALAKNGKIYAAAKVYEYSNTTFNIFVTSSKVRAGLAAIDAMMGGAATNSAYQRDVKKIRDKYKN